MGLDEALELLGRFGRYQVITYILTCLAYQMPATWQLFVIVFLGYINPHRCRTPEGSNVDEWIPKEKEPSGSMRYSQCQMYINKSIDNNTQSCNNGYHYESDGFDLNDGTITIEWDLVCDKNAFVELSQTIFNIGVVFGFFFFTPFGDKFGRKKVFFVCQIMLILFGSIMAFSPNFIVFCTMQGITGAIGAGLYVTGTVMACEMFPVSLRSTIAPLTAIFGTIATMLISLWAFILNKWRSLQLGISLAGILFLFYYRWCPESLRWLEANGKHEEMEKILKVASKWNKVTLPENILNDDKKDDKERKEVQENVTLLKYLKSPRPRRYMIIMAYVTFVNNVMFFGLSLMTGAFKGSIYVNFFLNSFMDLPATIIAVVAMSRYGRRWPLALFYIFAGVFMGLAGGVTLIKGIDVGQWVLGLSLIARIGIGGSYAVELIYTQEIFPTNLRNTGFGITGGAGFIGSILSPFTVFLFRMMNWLPCTIFAVLSIIGGLLTFLLPETVGRDLPLTVEEVASWPLTLTEEEQKSFKEERIFCRKENEVSSSGEPEKNNDTKEEPVSTVDNSRFRIEPNNLYAFDNPCMMFTSTV